MDPLKQKSWENLSKWTFFVLSGTFKTAFAVKGHASGPYIVLSGPFKTAFGGKVEEGDPLFS